MIVDFHEEPEMIQLQFAGPGNACIWNGDMYMVTEEQELINLETGEGMAPTPETFVRLMHMKVVPV